MMPAHETELSIFEFADSVDDTLFTLDENWKFVAASRQALKTMRQNMEDLVGRSLWTLYPALIGTPLAAAYRKVMAERVSVHLEHPSVISNCWYDVHIYPYQNGIAVYGRDITQRKLAERAMQESEERLRTQYDNIPIPTYTWQRSGQSFKLINYNAAASVISNGTTKHVLGKQLDDLFADAPIFREAIWTCWETGQTVRREIQYNYRFTVKSRDLALTVARVPPDMLIVHSEDITNQKDAERKLKTLNETLEQRVAERTAELEARTRQLEQSAERNRLLVREVEHRVGNNLTGLIGLVNVMRMQSHDVDSFASAIDARLKAMSQVHKILTAGEWKGAELSALARSTLDALQGLSRYSVPQRLEGPEVPLNQQQAYALALILAEWFTNSCKYGAHSSPGGDLQIRWTLGETGCELSWTERGGPPPSESRRSSLGMALAQRLSASELHGHCEMRFPAKGAEHLIQFPV